MSLPTASDPGVPTSVHQDVPPGSDPDVPTGSDPGAATVAEAAAQAVRLLTERGRTVAVAESLTGGLVVAALVGVPGASKVVRGGVVAYATDLKASLLGVDEQLLSRVGAVDPDVAAAMARGVAVRLGADYGLATTGVAGPDPQDGHPVGEVWISLWDATADRGTTTSLTLPPTASRPTIRTAATAAALTSLTTVLDRP
jgi:nicotinamide-nucleotide amidase